MAGRAEVELGFDDKEIRAGLAKAEARFDQFGKKVAGHGKHAESGFKGMAMELGKMAVGAFALEKVVEFVKATGEQLIKTSEVAKSMDWGAENVNRMRMMAKGTGVEVDAVNNGLVRLNRQLSEDDPELVKDLKQLGINVDELKLLEPDQQIIAISDALHNTANHGAGAAESFKSFGKSFMELMPMLRTAPHELEELSGHAHTSAAQMEKLAEATHWFSSLPARGVEKFNEGASGIAGLGQTDEEAEKKKAAEEHEAEERKAGRLAQSMRVKERAAKAQAIEMEKEVGSLLEQRASKEEELMTNQLSDMDKLTHYHEKIAEVDSKLDTVGILDPRSEVHFQMEKLALMEKELALKKQLTDKAEAAQEFADQIKVENLRAGGQEKKAKELEKQLAIQKEAKMLEKEFGVHKDRALEIAKDHQAVKDKGEKRKMGRITTDAAAAHPWGLGVRDFHGLDSMKNRKPLYGTFPGLAHLQQMQADRGADQVRRKLGQPDKPDKGTPTVKLTEGETLASKLDDVVAAIKEITAY